MFIKEHASACAMLEPSPLGPPSGLDCRPRGNDRRQGLRAILPEVTPERWLLLSKAWFPPSIQCRLSMNNGHSHLGIKTLLNLGSVAGCLIYGCPLALHPFTELVKPAEAG